MEKMKLRDDIEVSDIPVKRTWADMSEDTDQNDEDHKNEHTRIGGQLFMQCQHVCTTKDGEERCQRRCEQWNQTMVFSMPIGDGKRYCYDHYGRI